MSSPILSQRPLGFPWVTEDPFLFCVHHDDAYPVGTDKFGPAPALLGGRDIGQDFAGKDGWRMYHGTVVPGFPQHPHRGFETVTVARRGFIDHADSLGAAARYGKGDVQWLTAGRGIVHSEMFPLLSRDQPNPVELFQIWLNLPATDKMVDPHFTMLWDRTIPRIAHHDAHNRLTEITAIAGKLSGKTPPKPPPHSWASRADSDVAIWCIRMQAGATWTLPKTAATTNRMLYFFAGQQLAVSGEVVKSHGALKVRPDAELTLEAGADGVEILVLQGKPIGAPVVQYGPFVMNTRAEIQQAFADYQSTGFGGWPWPHDDPVHGGAQERFARHADGRKESSEG